MRPKSTDGKSTRRSFIASTALLGGSALFGKLGAAESKLSAARPAIPLEALEYAETSYERFQALLVTSNPYVGIADYSGNKGHKGRIGWDYFDFGDFGQGLVLSNPLLDRDTINYSSGIVNNSDATLAQIYDTVLPSGYIDSPTSHDYYDRYGRLMAGTLEDTSAESIINKQLRIKFKPTSSVSKVVVQVKHSNYLALVGSNYVGLGYVNNPPQNTDSGAIVPFYGTFTHASLGSSIVPDTSLPYHNPSNLTHTNAFQRGSWSPSDSNTSTFYFTWRFTWNLTGTEVIPANTTATVVLNALTNPLGHSFSTDTVTVDVW